MRLWFVYDKELATASIRTTVSHRQRTAFVFMRIANQFVFNCVTRTACTIAIRATTLRYEARNYTMECQSIIETFINKVDKVLYCARSFFIK